MSELDQAPLVRALSATCSDKGYSLRIISADDHGPARIIVSDLEGHWLSVVPVSWAADEASIAQLTTEIETSVAAMPEARRIILQRPKAAVPTTFD